MSSHPVTELPPYEALSYTWGDSPLRFGISCNRQRLDVGKNLWCALHCLRSTEERRTLWIDAVCINQTNTEERNQQVALMGRIYTEAKNVVVWLGDETEDSPSALRLIRNIVKNEGVINAVSHARPLLDGDLATHSLPDRFHADWRAVDKLYWRSWFSRVWIIQEITLAKDATVLVGRDEISRTDLLTAAVLIFQSGLARLTDVEVVEVWRVLTITDDYHRREGKGLPLLDLLMLTRASRATMREDKVYGLLGLSSDANLLALRPDYNISSSDLYISVAAKLLTSSSSSSSSTGSSLRILSANDDHAWRSHRDLPSWVPDWAALSRALPYLQPGAEIPDQHTADQRPPQLRLSPDGRVLHARGLLVDAVCETAPAFVYTRYEVLGARGARLFDALLRPGNRWLAFQSMEAARFRRWHRMALGSGGRPAEEENKKQRLYPTGEDIETAWHRTVTADCFRCVATTGDRAAEDGRALIDRRALKEAYDAFYAKDAVYPYSQMRARRGPRHEEKDPGEQERAARFRVAVDRAVTARRLVVTKTGYLGICPSSTRVGDKVVALFGGPTPYVLRRMRKGRWLFVGECYVHGLMNGEVYSMGLMEQEFTIV